MLSTVLGSPTGIFITPIWPRRPEVFPQGCRELVGCPTENSQVCTFSANIFLTSVQVQLYPVTGKIYKKNLCVLGC